MLPEKEACINVTAGAKEHLQKSICKPISSVHFWLQWSLFSSHFKIEVYRLTVCPDGRWKLGLQFAKLHKLWGGFCDHGTPSVQ